MRTANTSRPMTRTESIAFATGEVIKAARLWAELGWCAGGAFSRRTLRKPAVTPGCPCDWCEIVRALKMLDLAVDQHEETT